MSDDFSELLAELEALEERIPRAARRGLAPVAQAMERDAKDTSAYLGMSGATRAATVAVVITADDDGSATLQAAYAIAAEHLAGFVGHAGAPLLEPAGTIAADEIGVVLTVPTDYIDKLETERGGEKAFIGPTMDKYRRKLAQATARAIREELARA